MANDSNGNGNGSKVFDDMTVGDLAKLISGEIRDVRTELSEKIDALDGRMGSLETEFKSLRMEVHQNQISFIKNHEALEKRVKVLEDL